MTRIIAGSAGGRRIETPRGSTTRPTSDRVREALFSAIESWCGTLSGLRFLDLYAGSGAVGLEAWSRGADVVTLVEQDRKTAQLISANAESLRCTAANVLAIPVARALARGPSAPFDIVFSDPPYDLPVEEVQVDLEALVSNRWLVPQAMVVVERGKRGPGLVWPEGIEPGAHKRYGETSLWYGHAAGQSHSPKPI